MDETAERSGGVTAAAEDVADAIVRRAKDARATTSETIRLGRRGGLQKKD